MFSYLNETTAPMNPFVLAKKPISFKPIVVWKRGIERFPHTLEDI